MRCLLLLSLILLVSFPPHKCQTNNKNKEEAKNAVLPPCASCKVLVQSFKKGMDKTSRGKFEGGDSAWEEDKLGSYKTSEVRLIEIQENVCKDLDHGETQCHSLAEELESEIEEWWFKKQETDPDLFEYLCITKAERCCPKDTYGPQCTECPGFPDSVCNNNGKCKGAGTRKGNGKCTCDRGYTGDSCFECASGFYQSYKDKRKLLCTACHSACKGDCTGGSPQDCTEDCHSGWRKIEEKGCVDIDECVENEESCPKNHFCINNEGNFTCIACDRACDGCYGDGPDMCEKCAERFIKKDNICVDTDILGRKSQENWARYVTYLGLAVATGIIFPLNIYIASVIGILVASYIGASEYMISQGKIQDAVPNLDLLNNL
ncbi:cysteine-rich with EGF-like domain protein 2 [Trichogramma pretiosum]|uniref:cysteine-rich with EGF-like domain protein 2 n=1 Tax=Trichogramma pretiosum TaxID=7493 RepID=UPI0006C95EF5|nr:cysteine-rich with EGF-like domain protein 2 [Trichogramma pretiosum]